MAFLAFPPCFFVAVWQKHLRNAILIFMGCHSVATEGQIVAKSFTPVLGSLPVQYGHFVPFVLLAGLAFQE